jgi:2-polyprenyl-6-hydroxyphenyl methylase/3-demethylubiquinone-9 3-methyltransferase
MVATTDNVDPGEIAKFESLASRWWDPDGEFRPLHEINPLRLDYVDRHAALDGKTVLDVGCGGGILAESMAARGAQVTGIDLGEAPLSVAKLHKHESEVDVTYRKVSAEELADETPGGFDIVTCMEMLEHVPEPASVVAACATLLKSGGKVFFSTINRTPKGFAFAIVGAEYLLRLLPRGTHEYARFIRPSELDEWGREAGLNLAGSTGMHYNPVFRDYRLGPGLDVNYLMYFERD